jgi:outer membrane protein
MYVRSLPQILCLIFIMSILTTPPAQAIVTKKQALEILKSNGFRWQQTKILGMEAEARTKEANAALLPHVDFFTREYLGKVNQTQYGFSDPGSLKWFVAGSTGIEFAYSLYDRSAIDRVMAAQVNEKMNEMTATEYQTDLTYLMLVQYLNVQRLVKNLEVIKVNLDRNRKLLEAAQKKLKTGFGISLDVARAQGLVQHEKLKQLEASLNLSRACRELATTLSEGKFDCDLEPLQLRIIDEKLIAGRYKEIIQNRADIQAARLAVNVASHLKEMETSGSLPKIAAYGELSTFGSHPLASSSNGPVGAVGIQITLPLYSGGFREGRIQEESARELKALYQVKNLEVTSLNEFQVAVEQMESAHEALEVAEVNVSVASQELEFAEKKFVLGAVGNLELASAQVNFASAQDLKIQSVFAYEIAKLTLFKNTGSFEKFFE